MPSMRPTNYGPAEYSMSRPRRQVRALASSNCCGLLPEESAHLPLLCIAEIFKHVVQHGKEVVTVSDLQEGAIRLPTFPPALPWNIQFFIDALREVLCLSA